MGELFDWSHHTHTKAKSTNVYNDFFSLVDTESVLCNLKVLFKYYQLRVMIKYINESTLKNLKNV